MIDKLPLEFQPLAWWLRSRIDLAKTDQRGEVVPWVIIVAVTAALAIAVGAIIVDKVMQAQRRLEPRAVRIDHRSPQRCGATWEHVVEMLEAGEMPPEGKKQPSG